MRRKIAFFTSLASLLALLAGVAATVLLYQHKVRQQSARELDRISQNTPQVIETVGNNLTAIAQTLILSPVLSNCVMYRDDEELSSYLATFLKTNRLDFVEVTDKNGYVLIDLIAAPAPPETLSQNPLALSALKGGPYGHGILKHHEQIYISATIPIYYDAQIQGTITVGNLFNRELVNHLINIPGVDFAFWTDPQSSAIVPLGQEPLPPIANFLNSSELFELESGETIVKNLSLRNNTLQCAISNLRELSGQQHYYFANYRSLNYLIEANQLILVPIIALSLLILLVMVHFAWWVSHRLAEPLEELTRATQEMARLNFADHLNINGCRETEALTASFNHLSQTLRDTINQKDKYAAELAELNKDLAHLVAQRTEELEHINLRLNKEVAEKDDLLRTVAHDLGAPLRNIAGLTRLLERKTAECLDLDSQDKLDRIRKNAMRQLDMLDQLLELSRLKTRRSRFESVDLMTLLGQIRQDFSFAIEEKGIRIDIGDILPTLYAERDRVQRVFQNLIDNAIKYLGKQPNPEIEIGWSENQDTYLFFVRDNGMGIPADQRSKIFGIFQRVKNQEISLIEGKGLGLASVKTIVELYGGEIWVDSEINKGSTFYFTLDRNLVDLSRRLEPKISDGADNTQMVVYEENTVN